MKIENDNNNSNKFLIEIINLKDDNKLLSKKEKSKLSKVSLL